MDNRLGQSRGGYCCHVPACFHRGPHRDRTSGCFAPKDIGNRGGSLVPRPRRGKRCGMAGALFPPAVLVLIAITTPEVGKLYSGNPLFLSPVIIGSGVSYWLSMRMIRNGLSIEASMGLQAGGQGEIRLDRLGRVL